MPMLRQTIIGCAFGALCIPGALAAPTANDAEDPLDAMPGDDALTCDQIFQQGIAESQKDQTGAEPAQRRAHGSGRGHGRSIESTTAEDTAGRVLAPEATTTPCSRAAASSTPIPATKARPSARSR